jgi:hypothetical protein
MFKTTDITCPCGNTKGFYHSDKLAECTSCATPVHVDTPVYHTYNVTPLHQIAKDQAVIDMWLDDQPFIDWSTCFDVNNIRVAV